MLIEALTKAEIPNLNDGPKYSLFSSINWNEKPFGEIEIIISNYHFNTGALQANFRLIDLSRFIQELCDEDDRRAALVDALEYIKAVTLTLLPITQNKLLKRVQHTKYRFLPKSEPSSLNALFEMMQAAYVDGRAAMEQRLERRPKPRRGGSDPKLPPEQRESLHVEYDTLHKVTKQLKKDYNSTSKAFSKTHRRQGFTRAKWVQHWYEHSKNHYPDELQQLLSLFATDDEPSAAIVAYRYLAAERGHKASYMPD
jgi:hypothetical protein